MATSAAECIPEELTIEIALNLLTDVNYFGYLRAICSNTRVNLQRSFPDMIETIVNDPKEWFHAFPQNLRSPSALAKPKAAVLSLLRHNTVRRVYGDSFCDANITAIEKAWRENKSELIASRAETVPAIMRPYPPHVTVAAAGGSSMTADEPDTHHQGNSPNPANPSNITNATNTTKSIVGFYVLCIPRGSLCKCLVNGEYR